MELKTGIIVVGLVLGCGALGAVSYVWVRFRKFGAAGAMLSLTGAVLVGLAVLQAAQFGISTGGVKRQISMLEERVKELSGENQALAHHVQMLLEVSDTLEERLQTLRPPVKPVSTP